jgi:hypothetical protein
MGVRLMRLFIAALFASLMLATSAQAGSTVIPGENGSYYPPPCGPAYGTAYAYTVFYGVWFRCMPQGYGWAWVRL